MQKRRFVVLSLAFLMACASGSTRPANLAQPELRLQKQGNAPPFFGSGYTAAVNFDVEIHNRATTPIVVTRIELQTPGMVQYAIYPTERFFRDTIEANTTRTFAIPATAYTDRDRLTATEPLTVRAVVDFEAGTEKWREIYLSRLAD